MKYTQKAPAKINLSIDVLRKRPDGFHDVIMIMQSIALYDTITVKPIHGGKITVTSDSRHIPEGSSNIAYKAAEFLRHKYNVKDGAEIFIEKNIPVSAGLAGGSTDAAAVLKLLDKAWKLKLSKTEILEAAKKLGSDVPFCVSGGTALAEGLGQKLTPLKAMPESYILLAKPDMDISTKEVYEGIDTEKIIERPDIEAMIKAINEGSLAKIGENLSNVLEYVTVRKCPIIPDIKAKLLEYGALGSVMSGSGPTVFGIFDDQALAYSAYDHIKHMVNEIFVVKPLTDNWEV
ncbi:MAG: 4-(cytidine 5'-diphospho)-2-C-methyl-D-erythritol kinase [Lutispora sp.]|nr:4-(cytidine 5'-diphospho)-2-C-methyl-D-erythritol kinase [Lutispora sp.]